MGYFLVSGNLLLYVWEIAVSATSVDSAQASTSACRAHPSFSANSFLPASSSVRAVFQHEKTQVQQLTHRTARPAPAAVHALTGCLHCARQPMGKGQRCLCWPKICLGIAWREPKPHQGQHTDPCSGSAVRCEVGKCCVPGAYGLEGHCESARSAG